MTSTDPSFRTDPQAALAGGVQLTVVAHLAVITVTAHLGACLPYVTASPPLSRTAIALNPRSALEAWRTSFARMT